MATKSDDTKRPAATGSRLLDEEARRIREKKPRRWTVAFLGAIVVLIVLGSSFALGRFTAPDSTTVGSSTTTEKVTRSVTGKSADQDKKDAATAALALINSSKTEGGDYQSRMKDLEGGDTSSVTDGMKSGIHLGDDMTSKGALSSSYQALVAINALVFEGKTAKLTSDDAWSSVQVDQETGTAYVPLGIYTGNQIPFSFEMVYVDGEWKLAPYSLLQAIQVSSIQSEASQQDSGN